MLLSAGTYGNVIRVLAPLNADDVLVDEGLAAFGAALEQLGLGELRAGLMYSGEPSLSTGYPARGTFSPTVPPIPFLAAPFT